MPPDRGGLKWRRALAHESRVALLEALRTSDGALDTAELAERVGLHVNTVRSHLALLAEAGLVRRRTEARAVPGRPRQLYTATPADAPDDNEGYQLVARMLASFVAANVGDPASAAEETGRQWGRWLTGAPEPFAAGSAAEATARLLELLQDLGFAPRMGADPSEIELHHCPFRSVAEAHPEVACSLHLGLMRGAMAQREAPIEVEELRPFVGPELCVTRVAGAPGPF